jgi:cell division septum initiation protein DivIVA
MFVSKKEHEELKKEIKEQDKIINELGFHLIQLQEEVNELKKPKEPTYFG